MTTEFVLQSYWLRDKFERQAQPFLATLYRAALRMTGQRADAEDLVHDTYVKAFQAYRSVEPRDEAACRAWLFRIMINSYRDRYRRRARSPEVAPNSHLEEVNGRTVPSREPGPDTQLEYKRFAQAAGDAIASLPPEVRLVVVLFFVEELSYREIAEIAQCPVGTVPKSSTASWRWRSPAPG